MVIEITCGIMRTNESPQNIGVPPASSCTYVGQSVDDIGNADALKRTHIGSKFESIVLLIPNKCDDARLVNQVKFQLPFGTNKGKPDPGEKGQGYEWVIGFHCNLKVVVMFGFVTSIRVIFPEGPLGETGLEKHRL